MGLELKRRETPRWPGLGARVIFWQWRLAAVLWRGTGHRALTYQGLGKAGQGFSLIQVVTSRYIDYLVLVHQFTIMIVLFHFL
jgi:hypothetical protein